MRRMATNERDQRRVGKAETLSEQELVARIRCGDEEAFESLFRSYYDALFDFVRYHVGAPHVAEELVQDVFMSIWKRGGDWQPHTSVRAYLYGAARNQAISHIRRRRVQRLREVDEDPEPQSTSASADEVLAYNELERVVGDYVDALPERRRLIYILSRQHGLSYREIAEALDISLSTVEVQMWRALKYLRERLSSYLASS